MMDYYTLETALKLSILDAGILIIDNGSTINIDDVLTEHGGLLHVLPLAVHLSFFAG